MAKLIPIQKIKTGLTRKGFKEEQGRKHKLLRLYVSNKRTGISTSLSRGSKYKEYRADLLKCMSRGLRLDITKQLVDLIECPMSYDEYVVILQNKNISF